MSQVFYIRYQKEFGNKDYSDTISQFINVHKYMYIIMELISQQE